MISKELMTILLNLSIGSEDFFKYIEKRVKVFDLAAEFCGCFPIIDDDGFIKDIRVLVPSIKDELTLRVNIHEFTHAYDLFLALNKPYNLKTEEEREELAIQKEMEYVRKLH